MYWDFSKYGANSSRRGLLIVGLPLAALLVHLLLFGAGLGIRLELAAMDWWFELRGQLPPPKDVLIVSIDEQSYRHLNLSPLQLWPRAWHAKLLKKLAAYQAKAVALDVIFGGPGLDAAADRELADAMRRLPVVIATDIVVRTRLEPDGPKLRVDKLVPWEQFTSAATELGRIGLQLKDGVVRQFKNEESIPGQAEHTLAEAAVKAAGMPGPYPTAGDYINYYGPSGSIVSVSFYQVLDEANPLPAEVFKDKIVFVGYFLPIGVAGTGQDVSTTPFYGAKTFGVEVHATAAANMLSSDWIHRFPPEWEVKILQAVLLVIALAVVVLRPWWALSLLALVDSAWGVGAYHAFKAGYFIPGMTAGVIVLPLVFLTSSLYYYFITHRAQAQIRSAFSRYLTPEMVDRIAREPEALQLGGQLVEATVFFSDITGFTSLAERHDAQEVCALLNRYFTEVANIVLERQGTLIKFIGDGLFALWGAPIAMGNSDCQAVESALLIQKKIQELAASGTILETHTRVGIHRGNVVVGNLGSERRFDYTAVGDAVNLASRLELLNKHFGTSILISEAVASSLDAKWDTLPMGNVKVYGKEELVRVYSVFNEPLEPRVTEIWEEALHLLELSQVGEAGKRLAAVVAVEPRLEKAASIYQREITRYLSESLDRIWRGELVFTEK